MISLAGGSGLELDAAAAGDEEQAGAGTEQDHRATGVQAGLRTGHRQRRGRARTRRRRAAPTATATARGRTRRRTRPARALQLDGAAVRVVGVWPIVNPFGGEAQRRLRAVAGNAGLVELKGGATLDLLTFEAGARRLHIGQGDVPDTATELTVADLPVDRVGAVDAFGVAGDLGRVRARGSGKQRGGGKADEGSPTESDQPSGGRHETSQVVPPKLGSGRNSGLTAGLANATTPWCVAQLSVRPPARWHRGRGLADAGPKHRGLTGTKRSPVITTIFE